MKNHSKIIKSWAIINTRDKWKIPIYNCDKVKSVKSSKDFEFIPWAIFGSKKEAMKVLSFNKKEWGFYKSSKVVPCVIILTQPKK